MIYQQKKHVPDQSVDFGSLNVVQLFHWCLDLGLVSSHIDNEHKCVVVFNLLHGRLCGQRMLDDGKVIKFVSPWSRVPWVFGSSLQAKGFGTVEVDICADLPFLCSLNTFQYRLLGLLGLRCLTGLGRDTRFWLSWNHNKNKNLARLLKHGVNQPVWMTSLSNNCLPFQLTFHKRTKITTPPRGLLWGQ